MLANQDSAIAYPQTSDPRRKADSPPRKVVLATMKNYCKGTIAQRLVEVSGLIDQSAHAAASKYPDHPLDIVVMPENVFVDPDNPVGRGVRLEGQILETMAGKANQHKTNLVVTLNQIAEDGAVYNSAVVLNRAGQIIGTYRKVHPILQPNGTLEGGVSPGNAFPVVDCDFGRIGMQICWDMSYDDGFDELARQGVEIVFIPTASPQTARPTAFALRGRHYVVTSTRRDNASVINPAGLIEAQTTRESILVHQLDLSFALLHWTRPLENGKLFTDRFGDKVGYCYSEREDYGIFWSNDPQMSIAQMCREVGVEQFHTHLEHDFAAQHTARKQ